MQRMEWEDSVEVVEVETCAERILLISDSSVDAKEWLDMSNAPITVHGVVYTRTQIYTGIYVGMCHCFLFRKIHNCFYSET